MNDILNRILHLQFWIFQLQVIDPTKDATSFIETVKIVNDLISGINKETLNINFMEEFRKLEDSPEKVKLQKAFDNFHQLYPSIGKFPLISYVCAYNSILLSSLQSGQIRTTVSRFLTKKLDYNLLKPIICFFNENDQKDIVGHYLAALSATPFEDAKMIIPDLKDIFDRYPDIKQQFQKGINIELADAIYQEKHEQTLELLAEAGMCFPIQIENRCVSPTYYCLSQEKFEFGISLAKHAKFNRYETKEFIQLLLENIEHDYFVKFFNDGSNPWANIDCFKDLIKTDGIPLFDKNLYHHLLNCVMEKNFGNRTVLEVPQQTENGINLIHQLIEQRNDLKNFFEEIIDDIAETTEAKDEEEKTELGKLLESWEEYMVFDTNISVLLEFLEDLREGNTIEYNKELDFCSFALDVINIMSKKMTSETKEKGLEDLTYFTINTLNSTPEELVPSKKPSKIKLKRVPSPKQ